MAFSALGTSAARADSGRGTTPHTFWATRERATRTGIVSRKKVAARALALPLSPKPRPVDDPQNSWLPPSSPFAACEGRWRKTRAPSRRPHCHSHQVSSARESRLSAQRRSPQVSHFTDTTVAPHSMQGIFQPDRANSRCRPKVETPF